MSTHVELQGKTSQELRAIQAEIEQKLIQVQKDELANAFNQMLDIARSLKFNTIEDFLVAATGSNVKKTKEKGPRKPVAIQYENPENKTQTWTGRGKQPRWLSEQLANGKTLADFKI